MAGRDKKETRELKVKALWETIESLKEQTTPLVNMVTVPKIIELVNQQYFEILGTEISDATIKKPRGEYVAIKKFIDKYKIEHIKIKKAATQGAKSIEIRLKKDVESLMSQVATFYDEKLLLNEKLEAKERSLQKSKKNYQELLEEIDRLRA